MPRLYRKRRLRFGKRAKLFRARRAVYRRRKTYVRRRRSYGSRRRSARLGRRFANSYTKVNAVVAAGSVMIESSAAFGTMVQFSIPYTMTQLIGASQAVASLYGGYQYYRIRRGYAKWVPKINLFDGQSVASVAGDVQAHLKPRLFTTPYTTSFDSQPTNFQALLEYGNKKEWPVSKTIRIPFACTVEDGLASAGILGTAYMPRKCPWVEMARTSLPIYLYQYALVSPQRVTGQNTDIVVQEWDVEYHFCLEMKRIKF